MSRILIGEVLMTGRWQEGRQLLAVLALLTSILSGKLQLPLHRLGIESSLWLDVRLLALLVALTLLAPEISRISPRFLTRPILIFISALFAYLFLRSFFDVYPDTGVKRLDYVYMLVQIVLLAVAISRKNMVFTLGYSVLALALAYLAVAIGGQLFEFMGSKVNYGLGWGPVGGPITFNRVQFLAACVSMCFAAGSPKRGLIFSVLAAVFLFATIGSLQKAAIVAAFAAILIVAVSLIATKHIRQAAPLLLIVTVAAIAFTGIYGDRLSGRLTRLTVDEPGVPTQTLETTRFLITEFGVKIQYCSSTSANISDASEIPCRTLEFADRTSRLVFAAEALIGFFTHPLFGNGIASFAITVPQPDTLLPDFYRYPHNLVLEVAYEGGAIGILLLVAATIAVIGALFRSRASVQTKAYAGMFMIFLFANTMFAGDFYDSRLLWLCGIAMSYWKFEDTEAHTNNR